jgi:hypothetical protein
MYLNIVTASVKTHLAGNPIIDFLPKQPSGVTYRKTEQPPATYRLTEPEKK